MQAAFEGNRRVDLIATLGKGGFGSVYLADLHGAGGLVQRVAVKVLNEEMAKYSDIAARQRDEARLLAQLNHDHIVKVIDLGEMDGRPAVIMEYVEGVDCDRLIRAGTLPPRAALEILAAAASALDAACNAPSPRTGRPLNVVHRDIKPANLLVSIQGGLKVLDFGIARAEFDREGRTQSVQYGTVRYMAPETFITGQVAPPVDVYALGVTACELLLGRAADRPPLNPSRFDAFWKEVVAEVVALPGLQGVAPRVRDLLTSMLAFDPARRPRSGVVHELSQSLSEDATGEGLKRYARRAVPPILEAARARSQGEASDAPTSSSLIVSVKADQTWAGEPEAPGPSPTLAPVTAETPASSPMLATAAIARDAPRPPSEPPRRPKAAPVPAAQPYRPAQAPPAKGGPRAPAASGRSGVSGLQWVLAGVLGFAIMLLAVVLAVPEPAPLAPAAAAVQVQLSGAPATAELWVDGQRLPTAPADLSLPPGEHTIRVVDASGAHEQKLTVGATGPQAWQWNGGTSAWEPATP